MMSNLHVRRMIVIIIISIIISVFLGQILSMFIPQTMTLRRTTSLNIEDTTYSSRIVIYSTYTGEKIISIEGRNSVRIIEKNKNTFLKINSLIGPSEYKYTTILLHEGISFIVESIDGSYDDEYYYNYREYDKTDELDFKIKF